MEIKEVVEKAGRDSDGTLTDEGSTFRTLGGLMMSSEFLEIARSRAPMPSEIDELLTNHVSEDLWLEYKRGRWLTDTNAKRQRKLRRYVAGFANADGGAILVGVAGGEEPEQLTDKQWAVDGCPPGPQPWDEWASNSLSSLSGYLSRQPRIYTVQHAGGTVLVVVVRRSNGLVPCVEDGRPVYYMRIGHQTLPLDPSLYADLVLGRRQAPNFEVELLKPTIEPGPPALESTLGLRVNFIVRNESLVWVPDLQVGIIGNADRADPATMRCTDGGGAGDRTQGERAVSRALSDYVEVLPKSHELSPYSIRSRPRPPLNTAPFASIKCDALFTLPNIAIAPQQWWGAIYIAPTNGLPQWFAVRIEYQCLPKPHLANVTKCEAARADDLRIPIAWGNLKP